MEHVISINPIKNTSSNKSFDLKRRFRFPNEFVQEKSFYIRKGNQEMKIRFTRKNTRWVKNPSPSIRAMERWIGSSKGRRDSNSLTSLSFKFRIKWKFQEKSSWEKNWQTKALCKEDRQKRWGKVTEKGTVPTQISSQNLMREPSPKWKDPRLLCLLAELVSHPFGCKPYLLQMIAIRPFSNAGGLHDPQSLLDSMVIKLVNTLGKEINVVFSPNTYNRKKKVGKELQRLATTVNYRRLK